CKQIIHNDSYMGLFCSEFCEEATHEEIIKYLEVENAFTSKTIPSDGLYLLYPCASCGNCIEDVVYPESFDRIGSCCFEKVKIEKLTNLLKEALPHLYGELKLRIQKQLDK